MSPRLVALPGERSPSWCFVSGERSSFSSQRTRKRTYGHGLPARRQLLVKNRQRLLKDWRFCRHHHLAGCLGSVSVHSNETIATAWRLDRNFRTRSFPGRFCSAAQAAHRGPCSPRDHHLHRRLPVSRRCPCGDRDEDLPLDRWLRTLPFLRLREADHCRRADRLRRLARGDARYLRPPVGCSSGWLSW